MIRWSSRPAVAILLFLWQTVRHWIEGQGNLVGPSLFEKHTVAWKKMAMLGQAPPLIYICLHLVFDEGINYGDAEMDGNRNFGI